MGKMSTREGHNKAESGVSLRKKVGCLTLKKEEFFTPDLPFYIDRVIHKGSPDEISLHRHQFIELVYVREGGATHRVDGKRSRLHKGDVFILSQRMKHRFIVTPPETLEIINCLFLPMFIHPHLSSLRDIKGFIDFGYIVSSHFILREVSHI